MKHLNTSTLVIGPTGSGKSFLLATAAEWMWETHQKVSAYYLSDLGGYPDRMATLVRAGIVWLFNMRTRGMDLSFETAQLCCQGYWPATMKDALTGTVAPGVAMVGPTQVRFKQTHLGCNTTRDVAYRALLQSGKCPGCGKQIVLRDTQVEEIVVTTPGFERIGVRMYDGLSSISEWYLQDLSHRVELGGEMGSLGGTVTSGNMSFRSNNRAQVGFAQSRAHELVSMALAIPGQVVNPIFTAISHETTDKSGQLQVVGPKLAGDAKTEGAPAWFGNSVEAAVVAGDQPGQKIRRLYLSEYVDGEGRRHLLKHRSDPRYIPEYIEDAPYSNEDKPSEMGTGFNLGRFFQLLADAAQAADQATSERFPNAPGLAGVPTDFSAQLPQSEAGEAQAAAPATTPAPAAPRPAPTPRRRTAAPRAAAAPVQAELPAEPVTEPVTEDPQPAEAPAEPETPAVAAAPAQTEAPTPPSVPAAPPAPTAAPATARPVPRPAGNWAQPASPRPMPAVRRPAAPPVTPKS